MAPAAASNSGRGESVLLNFPENSRVRNCCSSRSLGQGSRKERRLVSVAAGPFGLLRDWKPALPGRRAGWRSRTRGCPPSAPSSRQSRCLQLLSLRCSSWALLPRVPCRVRTRAGWVLLGMGAGHQDLRAEVCTGLQLVSPFLAQGWGSPKAILGSSSLQAPRAMSPGMRKGGHRTALCH